MPFRLRPSRNSTLRSCGKPLRKMVYFSTAPKFTGGRRGVSRAGQGAIVSRGVGDLVSGGEGGLEDECSTKTSQKSSTRSMDRGRKYLLP